MSTKNKNIYCLLMLIGAALLLLPHPALAQSLFTVDQNDVTRKYVMDYLFGPLDALNGASNSSPLGAVVKAFNTGILALGGLWLLYIYIAGTAQGAHDGQFLGKRWNNMWVPARILIGTTLAFPSLSGGFCLAQWIVFQIALQGVGFANSIWSAYSSNLGTALVSSSPIDTSKTYAITRQLFLNNLCVDLFNQAMGNSNTSNMTSDEISALQSLVQGTKFEASGASNGKVFNIDYKVAINGTESSSGLDTSLGADANSVCGVAYAMLPQSTTTTSAPPSSQLMAEDVSASQQIANGINQATATFEKIHETQLVQLQAQTAALASQYVANPASTIGTQLNSLAQNYTNQLQSAQAGVASNLNSLSSTVQKGVADDGWVMAGASYFQIAQIQNGISQAIYAFPTVLASKYMNGAKIDADLTSSGGDSDYELMRLMSSVRGSYVKAAQVTADSRIASSEFAQEDVGLNATSDDSKIASLLDKIANNAELNPANVINIIGANPDGNPIATANQMGSQLISWSWWLLGGALVGGIFSSGIGFLGLLLWGYGVFFGFLLAYVVPMIPFIIYYLGFVSWVAFLIECILAAPLWAILHINPEGEGLTGASKLGYKLIITMTLRPALQVCALIACNLLFIAVAKIFNIAFGFVTSSLANGASTGERLIAIPGGIGVYFFCISTICYLSFKLIHILPTQLIKWFGGETSGYEHFGQEGATAALAGGYLAQKGIGSVASNGSKALRTAGKKLFSSKDDAKEGGSDNNGGDNGGSGLAMQLAQSSSGGVAPSLVSGSPRNSLSDAIRKTSNIVASHQKKAMDRDPILSTTVSEASTPEAKKQVMTDAMNAVTDKLKSGVDFDNLSPSERSLARASQQQRRLTSLEDQLRKLPEDEE
jgi:conjugal transfer/type IV secretion protein DotA/TraY